MAASMLCLTEILEMTLFLVNLLSTLTGKREEALQKKAFSVECCKLTPVILSFGGLLRDL